LFCFDQIIRRCDATQVTTVALGQRLEDRVRRIVVAPNQLEALPPLRPFPAAAAPSPERPLVIGLIAIPLLIQTYGIFAIGYAGARWLKLPHNVAAPACLIGTSNFFELAVAVAISLFGMQSGAALATVVGVLVEVPVMLSLVAFINRTPHWFAPSA
jgi:hypothetical protein